jgi:hypothetical protein
MGGHTDQRIAQALVEAILGRKLEGTKVELSARPAHAHLYRRYFSGTVSFGTEVSALAIPESAQDDPTFAASGT